LYERADLFSGEQEPPPDILYQARDRPATLRGNTNVYETVNLLRKRPSSICTTRGLAKKLQCWSVIGGYDRIYDRPSLSNCLSADLALEWGSLVNLCRSSGPEHIYQLMFKLGLIAFAEDVDMQIVRTLIAFCVFDDLMTL